MNKSIVLGLLMAMLVPTAAFADGHAVSLDGDVRLRYEYGNEDGGGDLDNGLTSRTRINLNANVDDNTSFTAQMRHAYDFSNAGDTGDNFTIQQAYLSMKDLGSMAEFLGGWSMDIGRMNNPNLGSGRIINSADWRQDGAGPNNHDGFRLGTNLGGVDFDLHYWGNNDGSEDNDMIFNFGLGDMAGFADIGFYYVTSSSGDPGDEIVPNYMAFNINNIAKDQLMGFDLDVEFATYNPDSTFDTDVTTTDDPDGIPGSGDETTTTTTVTSNTPDGSLMTVSLGYSLDQFDISLSNTVADADWEGAVPHGTYGIADYEWTNAEGSDLDVTKIGVSTDALMDGMTVTLNYYTVASDSSGDDIGTELDLLLGFSCGTLGYASVSPDADGDDDVDYIYWQSVYNF